MNTCLVLQSFSALICLVSVSLGHSDLANGLGDHIEWYKWSDALKKASQESKPLMVVIHKTGCPACKALKPVFAGSKDIGDLSENFVMVNANNGEFPSSEPLLSPDGSYVPRILFLNSSGELLKDIVNEQGNSKFPYYYYTAESIVESMKKAQSGSGDTKSEL